MRPLAGVKVVDFSTLLPGPLASLILAEAGAEVIKVERPGHGDELRSYEPRFGAASAGFALLNRGKRSIALDLKASGARARLMPLLRSADVLIEQFRPGVMDRLGLGFTALAAINPQLIYCSITGYGQSGPKSQVAAHDLNYLAETGLLHPGGGSGRRAGGAAGADRGHRGRQLSRRAQHPARAARARRDGPRLPPRHRHDRPSVPVDVVGARPGFAAGRWPRPGGELLTGGSPRFQIYPTADARFLAAAPLEQRFWARFAELIGLEAALRDDQRDPEATKARVREIIRRHDAAYWQARFAGEDVCCNVVASLEEAVRDPHFVGRGLFAGRAPRRRRPLDPRAAGAARAGVP